MSAEILTSAERHDLETYEASIERGMLTFLEVGSALMAIRDRRLYRVTYASFEAYCRERWGWSRQRASQLIVAQTVAAELKQSTIVDTLPTRETQVRPLTALPAEDRPAAWQQASSESPNGKPTAAKVQEVVDRTLGKARVNGKPAADPPDVARARAAGRIPAEAEVEVVEPTEPDDALDAAKEEVQERAARSDEMGDADWLATLPLSRVLTGAQLKTFQDDATVWRSLAPHRKAFAHHATRAFNAARRKGHYCWRLKFFLGIESPEKWLLCPTVENGGCGGAGQVQLIGQCPKCSGRGYRINGKD